MTAGIAVGAALGLAACAPEQAQEQADSMGNATPAPAAQATGVPAGAVVPLGAEVTDAISVGGRILLRAGDQLLSGTVMNPAERNVPVDPECGLLASAGNAGTALLPCPDGIHVIAGNGTDTAIIGQGTGYTAAVGLQDGRILGHRADGRDVDIYGVDGSVDPVDSIGVSRHGTQLLAVPDSAAEVMELNLPETSVHEIHVDGARLGSSLRAGLGLARGAVGSDGTVAVTDATGSQLLIYTMGDIIRLHQMFPVPEGPWAVDVDDHRDLVWVTSTAAGVLTGWDVSGGAGIKVAELPLVADAQALVPDGNGGLIAYSATGAGVQHLDARVLDDAIREQAQSASAYRDALAPREPANRLPAGEGGDDAGEGATPGAKDEE